MNTEETTIKVTGDDGLEYSVTISYEQVCLRRGTFSSAALDPEEYYGIFANENPTIEYVSIKVDGFWEDAEIVPDDVTEKALDEMEYFA